LIYPDDGEDDDLDDIWDDEEEDEEDDSGFNYLEEPVQT
jgi:hypothetical protein